MDVVDHYIVVVVFFVVVVAVPLAIKIVLEYVYISLSPSFIFSCCRLFVDVFSLLLLLRKKEESLNYHLFI